MKKQGGFTLIELVVVIVILGILAVTAAPKFLNLQDDARESALQGLKGAMGGAAGIVYGKAAVSGLESVSQGKSISGAGTANIALVHGYPKASSDGIGNAVSGLSADWSVVSTPSNSIVYGFKGDTDTTKCVVTYSITPSATAQEPTIAITSCK
ncbi:type II secretion system protein [Vibrio tapetis subsp. quintayensis]|uniref:prepilin-type N-terminal cleavage/methylation domain-containing protein n=1 Tax=Vibrio tapetis TaxID=52443 RepID=UPI0025B4BC59|nr:type II secretion system protein [Vibrio tapetis]MDN3680411.1 type II secretion system protein [Vibrio tapetis subsp. quintayensis]